MPERLARWPVALLVSASLAGCAEGLDGVSSGPSARCAPGVAPMAGGGCRPAGLPPDMPCPPGEELQQDGSCQAAGIPPDGCGDGFAHDGEGRCEPILPAEPCTPGLMAIPGETVCREVAPCGSGDYGSIPVDATTQFVNGAYLGDDSDGTQQRPWKTITEGIEAAEPGAIVAVAAGSYPENLWIEKPVRLWGRCPAMVEVIGTRGAAIEIPGEGASGTEIRDLAVTGDGMGIHTYGADGVLVDRVWIHDTGSAAIQIHSMVGPTKDATVSGCLIEGAQRRGVSVRGSEAEVVSTVVRKIHRIPQQGSFGIIVEPTWDVGKLLVPGRLAVRRSMIEPESSGIYAQGAGVEVDSTLVRGLAQGPGLGVGLASYGGVPASGIIRRSVVEHGSVGVLISDSEALMDSTLVRVTAGRTVNVQQFTGTRGSLTAHASVIEYTGGLGVILFGSDLTMDATILRGSSGRGILAQPHLAELSKLTTRSSLLEQIGGVGVSLLSAHADIESTVIRGNGSASQAAGYGIIAGASPGEGQTALTFSASIIEHTSAGLVADGAVVTVDSAVVRDNDLSVNGVWNAGITLHSSSATRTQGTILSSLIERNVQAGVFVVGATATIESSTVKGTKPGVDGRFGDGIVALAEPEDYPTAVHVSSVRIESSARAGISNFGSSVDLRDTAIQCSAFDLEGEPHAGGSFTFNDLGGNRCGCPEANGACEVLSANLEPPLPGGAQGPVASNGGDGDGNDTFDDADPIGFPAQITGTLDPVSTDIDHYVFTGKAGTPIMIRIDAKPEGAPSDFTYIDTVVTLFHADHYMIAENDDPAPGRIHDSVLFTYLPIDGTYYVRVANCDVVSDAHGAAFPPIHKSYTLYVGDVDPEALVSEAAGGPTPVEITGSPGSYGEKVLAGALSAELESDMYTFTLPPDVQAGAGHRPVTHVVFFPGGSEGSGHTDDVQRATLREAGSGQVVAQVEPDFTGYWSDLRVPLTPGADYELLVEHMSGPVYGDPQFYFVWMLPEARSYPVEGELLNGVSNDSQGEAEALVGQLMGPELRHEVDGDITIPGVDVDYFELDTTGYNRVGVRCRAQRAGSGLRDLTITLFDAGGNPIPNGMSIETELHDASIGYILVPPGNGNPLAFSVTAASQDGAIAGRYYSCWASLLDY